MNHFYRYILYLSLFFFTNNPSSNGYIYSQENSAVSPSEDSSLGIEIIHATEAEYMVIHETDKGILTIRGGVIIRIGENIIRSDQMKINPQTGEILAEKNLSLTSSGAGKSEEKELEKKITTTITGESFYYHPELKTGVVISGNMQNDPFYIKTKSSVRIDEDTIISNMAHLTTCGEENPHYYFKAKKLYVSGENEIAAFGLIYYTGNTPVFYWPFLFQMDEGTGIITQYGYKESQGHFLQNTYYYHNLFHNHFLLNPLSAKIMFDWYQKAGWHLGAYLMKQSRNLDYSLSLAVAEYKYRSVLDKDGSQEISNQVLKPDGTYGEMSDLWYKLDYKMRYQWYDSYQKDSYSVIRIQFEEYSNADFDAEYSMRSEPETTIEALGAGSGFITGSRKSNLLWDVSLEEYYKDSYFLFHASRTSTWYVESNSSDSVYYPVYEMAPEIIYTRNFLLVNPYGRFFTGLYNDYRFYGLVEKYYNQGEEFKTTFTGEANTNFRTVFPFTSWFSYHPVVGFWIKSRFSKEEDTSLETANQRETFRAITSNQGFRTGIPEFYHRLDYRIAYAVYRKEEDPEYKKMLYHNFSTGFYSVIHPYADLSLTTSRDLRKTQKSLPERYYWSDLQFQSRIFYDFHSGFNGIIYGNNFEKNQNGITRVYHRSFMGISFHDRYDYSFIYQRSLSNTAGIFYEMGAYAWNQYPRINVFHTGISWQHDFIDSRFDDAFYEISAEWILHRFWFFSFGFKTSIYDASRYREENENYISFWQDLINSSIYFWDDSKASNLVLEKVYAVLEHDLHSWIMRLSVWTGRNRLLYGPQRRNVAEYYETAVYFSMTLKDIKGFGIPRSQVYRERPSESDFY